MKTGKISIKIFEALNTVAERHDIQAAEWARTAKIGRNRISDFRAIARGEEPAKLRRAFTRGKAEALLDALKNLIGGTIVNRELLELIEKMEDPVDKNIAIILLVKDEKTIQENMAGLLLDIAKKII